MMDKERKTFLDEVANHIIASEHPLETIKIIVPSNRSIRFLKEALKKVIDRPSFAPTIINVETFIEELSGLHRVSKISLLFEFYQIYKNTTPEDAVDSFDQYLSWASGLLQEFNDIDAYLVSQEPLFDFMVALEKVNQWGNETPLIKNYINFNKRLPDYYNSLYKQLRNSGKGYAGMQFREAVNNLAFYLEANKKHHFFVGFNALNAAEERIIQELISNGQASVLWDIDAQFYEDSFHVSGHFIRKYYKEWTSLKHKAKPNFKTNFNQSKNIEIISVAKNITQAKAAAQIVKSLDLKPHETTAVILGQESLLIPVISGIAAFSNDWNVTMGYPLQQTTVASFFNLWIEVHQYTNQEMFDFYRFQSLMQSCSISLLFKNGEEALLKILAQCRAQNRAFVPAHLVTQIHGDQGMGKLFFAPFLSVSDFLERSLQVCDRGYDYYQEKKDQDSKLLASYFIRFKPLFRQLQSLQDQYSFIKGLSELKVLLGSLLQMETIDFTGEPLNGIQVMGLLETRLLDFENVIITNVNEGILPSGKGTSQFLPYDVKMKFGLPTYLEQDTIFSYHFFRVLQRAKKIFLMYNSTSDGLFSGEKSRFLYQLEYFKSEEHQVVFKQVNTAYKDVQTQTKVIDKTDRILSALKVVANEGFSPSSLTLYIRNPYLFYERRVLRIKEPQAFDSTINAMDKGTLLHNVLETIYLPYLNQEMTLENYDQMMGVYEAVLSSEYKKVYHGADQRTGANYIVFELMKELIGNFIKNEKALIAQGNRLKIIALEEKFNVSIDHPKLNFPINLKGTVDRIDQWNDSIRIIDYKTGAVKKEDLCISEWDELLTQPKKSPLFQVLLYAYVFEDRFSTYNHFQAGVISFRNFNSDFFDFSIKHGRQKATPIHLDTTSLSEFEEQLFNILSQIFDKQIPFTDSE